jgi:sugar phosphate isomerase/epimerase
MSMKISRRDALVRAGVLAGGASFFSETARSQTPPRPDSASVGKPFSYSLNTATIRGQKLGIVRELEIAAQAGYQGIEPWVEGVQNYVKEGGTLADLRKRSSDLGLTIEGAIGFPEWIVDDDDRRGKGLERAKREMDLISQIGGKRFAAPPAGATDLPKLDLSRAAERYRALLEIGDQLGIVPELELWGFSKNLNRLGECVCVAVETGHPKACVLADVFHLHKGGSDFKGMSLLAAQTLQVLHLNDYPAEPTREKIDDSFRIYPGDGVAALAAMLKTLHATGGPKVLSLELFNRQYWSEDPLQVAKTGLAKMKAVVEKAGFKA